MGYRIYWPAVNQYTGKYFASLAAAKAFLEVTSSPRDGAERTAEVIGPDHRTVARWCPARGLV
jgi:hypothetical protein